MSADEHNVDAVELGRQEALLKTGSLQDAVLNSANFSIIATDELGVIQLFNIGAERMLGYVAEEVVNRITPAQISDTAEVLLRAAELSKELSTDIAPGFEALVFKASRGIEDRYELTYIRKDGSRFPAIVSVTALRHVQGKIIGYLLIGTDNSARKQVEERLQWTEESMRLMVESVTEYGIVMLDLEGRVVSWNSGAQRIEGYAADEILGEHFSRFYPRQDIELGKPRRDLEIVTSKGHFEDEGLRVRKDGTTFWANVVFTTIRDQAGNLRGIALLMRDLTERRKVEAELTDAKSTAEKANQAKSEFLSSMSHELRTPLNAILGFAQLLESDSPPPTPSQSEGITQILQAGAHLVELVNEVLDLTRIESGRLSWSLEPVSLASVISECRAMFDAQATERGIGVVYPAEGDPCFIWGDRTRVKQVLINLLSNAIKYNKAGGSVIVECAARSPHRMRVSIRDTGEGLSPEKRAQLFQPFNRLGQEAGAREGTGIGLVVTKRLVELMGGTIGVESAVGEGSVFWIELAVTAAPSLAAGSADLADSAEPGLLPLREGAEPRTLLYVEDNPANLRLVERILARRQDIRMLSAIDGTLGVALARASLPDMILMDINLPGISGTEAMQILRDDPATAHIPVVALSANAMPGDVARGLDAGFFRYLTKPIQLKAFMDTLDVALSFAEQEAARRP